MAAPPPAPLACGHVGYYAGICRYRGCANHVCAHCLAACETCGTTLCPDHQKRHEERSRVFCADHAARYRLLRLARWVLTRRSATTDIDDP